MPTDFSTCWHFKRYKNGALDALLCMNYVGSEALLNDTQLVESKSSRPRSTR